MNARRRAIDARLLELVRGRAGGTDAAIARAFENSGSFRSLCTDLRTCAKALARWETSDEAEARQRVDEYTDLLDELTTEVRRLVALHDPAGENAGPDSPTIHHPGEVFRR